MSGHAAKRTVALVTGGGAGIGAAICAALAARGDKVLVADRDETTAKAVATSLGGGASAVYVDVTDPASVRALADEIGAIDVLVNNVGWEELHRFLDTDEEYWQRIVEINYLGMLRVTRAVLPGMLERGYGRVVHLASDAGRVGSSMEAVYSGAKGAVIAFSKSLARETARGGVTSNSVCPGPTDTPLLRGMMEGQADGERFVEALKKAVPMRRLGLPEEVAAAVTFLSGPDAGFITGQTLSVSGGLTMV